MWARAAGAGLSVESRSSEYRNVAPDNFASLNNPIVSSVKARIIAAFEIEYCHVQAFSSHLSWID
jgi:hypothetical protein